MHISREIRKKLESSLPSYVLEYLTEKFEEAERYCNENKQLKQKLAMLEEKLEMKDTDLMKLYKYNQQKQEFGSGSGQQKQQNPIGYSYNQPQEYKKKQSSSFINYDYNPYEEEELSEYFPQYRTNNNVVMKRGVPGSEYNISSRRRRSYYNQQGGGGQGGSSGGSGGGSGSGGGGGSSASYNQYVPEIEKPNRTRIPIQDPSKMPNYEDDNIKEDDDQSDDNS